MRFFGACISAFAILVASVAWSAPQNDKLRTFLKSAGYGTLIGAGAGAASLAFVEDPGNKTNNIARGASLGLYVGIGVGIYLATQTEPSNFSWIAPMKDGAAFHFIQRF